VDIPGVHALVSIFISLSERFFQSKDRLRFLNHFKQVLGEDIEHVLAAKLRIHVRRFAEEVISMAAKKLVEREELLKRIERKNREAEEREKLNEDRDEESEDIEGYFGDTASEDREITCRVNDYQWLLIQFRILLLCTALFDEFLQLQKQSKTSASDKETNNLAWPCACFFIRSLHVFLLSYLAHLICLIDIFLLSVACSLI
jgi:hypothetical protein